MNQQSISAGSASIRPLPPIWRAAEKGETSQSGKPANPEEVPAGEVGSGENICRRCAGSGQIESGACPDCGGSGKVITPIGGA